MKKRFGFVLALALCAALSVGLAPKASAAGTTYNINAQSEWATVASGGYITLGDGDTLNIAPAANSPSTATTINIAADANVTINGGGSMHTGVCIRESTYDTAPHTVTINNLQITAPAGCSAYYEYLGTINLMGANVFAGPPNDYSLQAMAGAYVSSITSSTGGALMVSSANTMGFDSLWAITLNVQGNARVTATASVTARALWVQSALNVDSGASLTATSVSDAAIAGVSLMVTNNGLLTVSGGDTNRSALDDFGGSRTIKMGAGAVTSITSTVPETDTYVMIPTSGFQWQLSGGASLVAPDTVMSSPASISVAGGSTSGIVKLVPTATPTSPYLPMLRFTESPDMTGDRLGDTLAVDSLGALWVFPGSSSGQFGAPVLRLSSDFKYLLIAAPGDVNSDGRADVLAIDFNGNLWLYPGNGAKALGTSKQVGNGWTGWRLIPAGDLTGDGKADLLSIDSNGDLYMYAGRGDGTFGMKKKVGNGWNGWDLFSAGDLNGDGKTDILGINSVGDLYQYAGRGDGTFAMKVKAGNGWIGYTLAAGGDLNGDGKADILGLDQSTRTLYVYLGQGNAKFAMKKKVADGW